MKDRPSKDSITGGDTPASGSPKVIGHLALSLAFFVIYILLDRPDVILTSDKGLTAWYPPAGLAMALLLGISPRYAPLVWLSSIVAGRLIFDQHILSWSAILGGLCTACVYAFGAHILRRRYQIDIGMRRQRDVLLYLLVTLLAALATALVNAGCLVADHTIPPGRYGHAAFTVFTGDAVALVGVAPFLLIRVVPWIRSRLFGDGRTTAQTALSLDEGEHLSGLAVVETLAQVTCIVVVLWIMFGSFFRSWQLFYLAFLPILWMAIRQGVGQAVNGILAFNFGVVVALDLTSLSSDSLSRIGLLMLAVSATGLVVGSAVSERHRVGRELSARSTFLNALIENSPLGIVVLDRDGRVQLCNDAFEALFRFRREELAGRDLDSLFSPPDGALEANELTALVASGHKAQKSLRRLRRDGTLIDVELNAVPLFVGRQIQGSFGIYKDISQQSRAAEEMKQNADALNQLVGELQLRTNQMTQLNEMSALLQSCASTDEAYAVVGQFGRKLFPVATAGALFIFRPSRRTLEAGAHWGQTCVSEAVFSPSACWGLRRGQANWSEHPGDSVICPHLKNAVPASYLCVPMIAQGDGVGILHLQYDRSESTRGSEVFETLQESQKRLALSVAAQIALSLASLRMRETLRDQSIRDPLTRLFNRRFLEESLARELQEARRGRRSLSVALIDLDHFKNVNDSFGHDGGDEVLRSMADLFRTHFRSSDIVCRYGGEEFAVVLLDSAATEAAVRANELRVAAKKLALRHEGQLIDSVTLSIGIAAFPENGATAEELLRAADLSLYESKRRGRDLVTTADSHTPRTRSDGPPADALPARDGCVDGAAQTSVKAQKRKSPSV
jgi:diguanylate cyclase (GGDEF)-like protein/PAS domain S-box-containing protein